MENKTLRDEMAMAALSGLIQVNTSEWQSGSAKSIANNAYAIADAMLEARNTSIWDGI